MSDHEKHLRRFSTIVSAGLEDIERSKGVDCIVIYYIPLFRISSELDDQYINGICIDKKHQYQFFIRAEKSLIKTSLIFSYLQ